MHEITIRVRDKRAEAIGSPVIVCGNSDYTVTFELDSEWSGYATKTARFNYVRDGVRLHQDVVFTGSSCAMPVMHDVYEVAVGIYAGSTHTSTAAHIPCERSATDDAAEHWDPAPDVYDQLLALLEDLPEAAGDPTGDALLLATGTLQQDSEIGITAEPTEPTEEVA